jgi:hypothetical protein
LSPKDTRYSAQSRASNQYGDELFIPTLPLNVVIPDTFNDDNNVAALFNVVLPDIFNVDINVAGLLKLTIEGGFNIAL